MAALECPNGHVGVPGRRFCRVCGEQLTKYCPNGHPVALEARFCRMCGSRAAPDESPFGEGSLEPAAATDARPSPDPRSDTVELYAAAAATTAAATTSAPVETAAAPEPAAPATTVATPAPVATPPFMTPPPPPLPVIPALAATTQNPKTPASPAAVPGGYATAFGAGGSSSVGGPPPYPPIEQRRSRRPLVLGAIAVVTLVAVGVAGALVATSSGGTSHHTSTGAVASTIPATSVAPVAPPTTSPPTTSATTTPTTVPSAQTAAAALATLLAQSVSDRTSIQDAAADVANCGPDLTTDVQVFTNAADSRATLIGGLSSLPGRSALPAPMLQDLTYAWTASQEADRDFAGWASDESNQGCTDNDTTDPDFQAATQPDDQATTYKTEFVGLWNPIATQFGQPTYSWQNL